MRDRYVVVIDSQADIRDAACLLLESHGISAKGYPTERSFVADVDATGRSPDCVVIDLFVTSAHNIAFHRRLRPVPTIVLIDDPGLVPPGLFENGQLHAVLKKPASPETFISTIEAALSPR